MQRSTPQPWIHDTAFFLQDNVYALCGSLLPLHRNPSLAAGATACQYCEHQCSTHSSILPVVPPAKMLLTCIPPVEPFLSTAKSVFAANMGAEQRSLNRMYCVGMTLECSRGLEASVAARLRAMKRL